MGPPYEPLQDASLRHLSYKVSFLIAINSARRISELSVLLVRKDLCVFHRDRVVLQLDPAFIPKVNSTFHWAQELVLPGSGSPVGKAVALARCLEGAPDLHRQD